MGERRTREERRRAREFEAFVAGAAGRLLHAATLLTGEPSGAAPLAQDLLVDALARTYADWDRLRGGDPYEHTRRDLAGRFARTARRYRRPLGGLLDRLAPQERLMLVLRLYEGVADEQIAASLGLPVERVRALFLRGIATVLSGGADGAGRGGDGDGGDGDGGHGDGGRAGRGHGEQSGPPEGGSKNGGPKAGPATGGPSTGGPAAGASGGSSTVVSRVVSGVRHTAGPAVCRGLARPHRAGPAPRTGGAA